MNLEYERLNLKQGELPRFDAAFKEVAERRGEAFAALCAKWIFEMYKLQNVPEEAQKVQVLIAAMELCLQARASGVEMHEGLPADVGDEASKLIKIGNEEAEQVRKAKCH